MLLSIEKLVYGGDGLAHTGPDEAGRKQAVFVPFVLPGEQVEATQTGQGRGFLRARVNELVIRSAKRIEPPCPYFGTCGGCHYQHVEYEHQLEIKSAILRETLRRTGGIEWQDEITVHAATPWHYRNRTRLQVVGSGGEFALAYFRFGSHTPLVVEQCPISSEVINRAIGGITAYGREGRFPSGVREIEFFADAADEHLLLELYLKPGAHLSRGELRRLFEELRGRIPELVTVAAFSATNERGGNGRQGTSNVAGEPHIVYRAAGFEYCVRPGVFFQTNRYLTEKLIELATAGRAGERALDLYAGVGLFAAPLARTFAQVAAAEASPASVVDLRRNTGDNVKVIVSTTEEFLKHGNLPAPDYVVVDPPRAGLGERVSAAIAELAPPALTYVSCDPATLARDLKVLLAAKYRIQALHLVDLFPQTFHIETVVHLERA